MSSDRSSERHGSRPRLGARGAVVVVVGLASVGLPARAAAAESDKPADKAMCAESYRNAQVQRKNGALKRARESLLVCVSEKCPSVMQPDCTRWLTEVEAALPSLAFAAKGADGRDLTAVRVSMDGQFLADALDGKAISVDPGSHTLRFENASEPPIEQTIIVREGEKARVVHVSWAKPQETAGASSGARAGGGPPTAAWILGGIGIAGLATFAGLGIHGMQRRTDLKNECFGSCQQDQVDPIKTELTLADVALGVGVVSLAVSAVLFLSSGGPSSTESSGARAAARPKPVWFGLASQKSGGAAGLAARF